MCGHTISSSPVLFMSSPEVCELPRRPFRHAGKLRLRLSKLHRVQRNTFLAANWTVYLDCGLSEARIFQAQEVNKEQKTVGRQHESPGPPRRQERDTAPGDTEVENRQESTAYVYLKHAHEIEEAAAVTPTPFQRPLTPSCSNILSTADRVELYRGIAPPVTAATEQQQTGKRMKRRALHDNYRESKTQKQQRGTRRRRANLAVCPLSRSISGCSRSTKDVKEGNRK